MKKPRRKRTGPSRSAAAERAFQAPVAAEPRADERSHYIDGYRRWPEGGQVQQGAYKGLREDKRAREVVKETLTEGEPPCEPRDSASSGSDGASPSKETGVDREMR